MKHVPTRSTRRCILAVMLGASCSAHGALVDRGGGLVYDTDRNITWLADGNYAMTSGYDADGLMWSSESDYWASTLSYGGYSDWRLPTSDQCGRYLGAFNCINSELGHLFYVELGGVAGQDISTTHNANFSLFQNLQSGLYMTSTTVPDDKYGDCAFVVDFSSGYQEPECGGGLPMTYALAVRNGDVAGPPPPPPPPAVPIPAAAWLLSSGLLALSAGFMRRRNAR